MSFTSSIYGRLRDRTKTLETLFKSIRDSKTFIYTQIVMMGTWKIL